MEHKNIIAPINENLNVVKYEPENIKNLIYCIRGKQVMLDSDVAMLYNTETRIINQTVKRNIERFPERFCFKLAENEIENSYGGRRKLPTVFTEQGLAMLSGLLKNEIAIKVSINIMDAFIEMRKFIANNGQIYDAYSLIIDIIKSANNKILIIDNKDLYHIGASLKDLGKKCFAISKIEDIDYINKFKTIALPK